MSENVETQVFNLTEADERAYLESVKRTIAASLADLHEKLHSRHAEMSELQEYLHQNKADLDHAEKASVRQSVNMMTDIGEHGITQYQRLTRLLESPYFGRIDVRDVSSEAEDPVYIGMHAFHDPETDRSIVHDWRAPISSIFYEFELGEAHFDAPSGRNHCELLRKRQYRIEDCELVFMLESSLNIQDDVLQRELSRASDDKMKNIVSTIQRDQNAIIRNDATHTLIIQGAAGSGKTSIALHRIAFLLYKYRDSISSDEILIISPNKVFAHYISQVLPELGEEMIQETTMEMLAGELLDDQFRFQSFAEQVAIQLAGKDKQYMERIQYKATTEFLYRVEEYARHVRNSNLQPVPIEVGLFSVDAEWIAREFRKYGRFSINEQINRVTTAVVDHMWTRYQKRVAGKDRTKVRNDLKQMFTHTSLKAIYKGFYEWSEQPGMFKQLRGGAYEYNDAFPLIYLKMLLEGSPSTKRMKHLVIDEMQDYTPVQYQVIANLFPCKKTILGDHHQSVSPLSASSAEAIRDVLDDSQCMYMHKSYRSTIEITQVAQCIQLNPDLDPIERHGPVPTLVSRDTREAQTEWIQQAIVRYHQSDHNTLGIICKTHDQAAWLHEQLSSDSPEVRLLDFRSTVFSQGVMIATAYLAKGLEFDQVIVPFADATNYRTLIDRHMLYVACTRAMHQLTFTLTGPPSDLLHPALESGCIVASDS
jgi:DNA helicase II / ATP-dependent DNA helicase PcrA